MLKRATSSRRTLRCLSWKVMGTVKSHFAKWLQKPGKRNDIQTWLSCISIWSFNSLGLLGLRALGRYLDVWVAVLEATSACRKCKRSPAHQHCRHMCLNDLNLGLRNLCFALGPAFICSTTGNAWEVEAGTSLTSVQNSLC